MKILGIETSGKIFSLALLEDEQVLVEYNLNLGLKHSELLFPLLNQALDATGWQISDLQGIAVDRGPGSFTGIRIGITTARSLAQVLNIPLVGVVSLDGLTYEIPQNTFFVCPLIDALGSEVYTTFYHYQGGWHRLAPYQLAKIDTWLNQLITYQKPFLFIGNATIVYQSKIKNILKNFAFISENNLYPRASSIALLGKEKLLRSERKNYTQVLPLYLRRSYAEIERAKCKV